MRFLIDANLPPALAQWLVARGHDASHCAEVLSPHADDGAIWSHAKALGAIVVTKDQDFIDIAVRSPEARVVLVRCGNLKLSAFEAWFLARAPAMEQLLQLGEAVVELR